MKYFKFLFISFLLVTLSCSKSNEEETFSVTDLLDDVTNLNILPGVTSFVGESNTLNTSVDNYLSSINDTNLVALQTQWKKTALAYANIYAFNIGEVRDKYMNLALYNWPTLPTAIENVLINNDEITEELVVSLSPQIKTLAALEYLLFDGNIETINTNYMSSIKRQHYLKYVALDLVAQSIRLSEIWEDPTNYATTFIYNEETGIKGSFNLFYNGLNNLIDTGKVTKIGKPAGLENSENTNPELTQAYFSHTSLVILKENILSVKNVYFNSKGLGIADYVFSIAKETTLNDAVETKITEVIDAIDAIPTNLYTAITTNPSEVKTLHEKLGELSILFSVDVRSILSITITSTDNDGD